MPLTIIDTDILIDQGRGISGAADFLNGLKSSSSLAISVVTQMELTVGCRNKTEQRELATFLARFQILGITSNISDRAVEIAGAIQPEPWPVDRRCLDSGNRNNLGRAICNQEPTRFSIHRRAGSFEI